MGKDLKQQWLGRGAASGVFSRGYVETKGLILAPQVGLEPTTLRLTAEPVVVTWLRKWAGRQAKPEPNHVLLVRPL